MFWGLMLIYLSFAGVAFVAGYVLGVRAERQAHGAADFDIVAAYCQKLRDERGWDDTAIADDLRIWNTVRGIDDE